MKNILSKPFFSPTQNTIILLVLMISLVGFISMDIYFPSLPAISKSLNETQGKIQLTLTLFLCGFGVSQLFYGCLSDFFGRRPILLAGFFIYLIGSILLIFSHSLLTLLVARLIQGAGAGAGASLCRVVLRDMFVGNKMAQVTSYLTIGIAFSTALAPALGGYVQEHWGFLGNFVIMLVFGGLVTIFTIIYLPETNKNIGKNSLHPFAILQSYGVLLKNKTFIANMFCAGAGLSGLLTYAIINPFLLQNYLHISPANYGLITLLIAVGELIGTYINSLFVVRVGYVAMMFVGISLMLIAAAVSLSFSALNIFTVYSIAIPSFLLTMSTGITIPNASAGAFSVVDNGIGTAGAIYGFFQIVITIMTTYFISTLLHQTAWDLGYIFLGLGLVSLAIYSLSKMNFSQKKLF
jgi:Bcr/CflA subfamily drug resistance transporter